MEVERKINDKIVKLVQGDVTDLEIEAFVFYARNDLNLGSGYGGAIAVRGGPSIQDELKKLDAVETGEAVITGAGNMKAKHIIHAVGPKFQEENQEKLLQQTMESTLKLAEENGLKALAFPPMGVGFYGVPPEISARIMIEAFNAHLSEQSGLEEIVICVYDALHFDAFKAKLT
ncbi:macro domain-containing protein [Acidobacteriota bacterium]